MLLMTKERGRDFALTYVNKYQNSAITFTIIFELCASCHMVTPNKYSQLGLDCSCKGCYGRMECGHKCAIAHILKKIDVNKLLEEISAPKRNGRPRVYQPVGYAAHVPRNFTSATEISTTTDVQAAQFFGLAVAVRFLSHTDRPFCGKITGARPMGKSSSASVMVYTANFSDQLGDSPDSCELTEAEMMNAHRLYLSYMADVKKRKAGKSFIFHLTME